MLGSPILLDIVTTFHQFNKFLGSDGGSLLKVGFEFLLFMLIAYMTTSQYLKNKNRQIKYLSISFLTLSLVKGITTVFYVGTIFGGLPRVWIDVIIPPIESTFEVIALFLLGVALTYQLLRIKVKNLRERFYAACGTITLGSCLFLTYWIFTFKSRPYELFFHSPQHIIFETVKLIVIGTFVGFILNNREKAIKVEKYAMVIVHALAIYAIPPMLHIINFLFFDGTSIRIRVLANPFPFLAVFLFIRYSYLKMADKASLMDKLDLTEKKYKKIKQVNRLKDEFVSIASHELKTPLTSINLYTSLLADGTLGQVNDKQKDALLTLKGETKRLTNLVNDLLDLSRIQNRKLILKKEAINFHHMVEETLDGFRAQNPQMTISNKVPKELQGLMDQERIRQVLINLVSNSAKFTPDDGVIEVSGRKTARSVIFSVKDNGKGIPKGKLNYLFQKFYQVDPHLAREEGISGLGLGLSIVKGIVDAHQGEITVDSTIDKGTKFTIKLPQERKDNSTPLRSL